MGCYKQITICSTDIAVKLKYNKWCKQRSSSATWGRFYESEFLNVLEKNCKNDLIYSIQQAK